MRPTSQNMQRAAHLQQRRFSQEIPSKWASFILPPDDGHADRAGPALTCPGFSFEELYGKSYRSLLSHKREQVTRTIGVAGLLLLHPEEKNSVSRLKESPSHQEPVRPCGNCSKTLKLSGCKNILRPKTSKPDINRYFPFQSITQRRSVLARIGKLQT